MCDQPSVGASSSGTPRGILKPPDERKLDARDDAAMRLDAKKRKAQFAVASRPRQPRLAREMAAATQGSCRQRMSNRQPG
eukprot:868807-Prymnesium_polylepis.1